MTGILIAIVCWSSVGLLLALLLRRDGHHLWTYVGLGIAYGPVVVIFLLDALPRHDELVEVVRQDDQASNEQGWIDVLVGLDGSATGEESAFAAVNLLDLAVRRLRIATVLDFETGSHPESSKDDDHRRLRLQEIADASGRSHVEIALLRGRADEALLDHAMNEGFDLIVVAHRQHRIDAFGSTSSRLARRSDVPILIGPPALASGSQPEPAQLSMDLVP
jgi:nucleotide-binding universal stress UspA family protein